MIYEHLKNHFRYTLAERGNGFVILQRIGDGLKLKVTEPALEAYYTTGLSRYVCPTCGFAIQVNRPSLRPICEACNKTMAEVLG